MKNFSIFSIAVIIFSSCGNVAQPPSDSQEPSNTQDYQSKPTIINPEPRPANDNWEPKIQHQSAATEENNHQEKQDETAILKARSRAYHSGVNAGVVAGKNDALQGNPLYTSFIQKHGNDEDGLTTKWNEGFVDGYTYAFDGFSNNPNFTLWTYEGDYVIK